MGLGAELEKFHRIDGLRVFSPSCWETAWPQRAGMPNIGYVARRLDLDQMLLDHAASVGAEVRQGTQVVGPVLDGGRVAGVIAEDGSNERVIRADVVIAADGAYSKFKRALAPKSRINGFQAVAIRAEMPAKRPDDHLFEIYLRIMHGQAQLPGYGWVFPLGDGRVNIGIGYVTSYKQWQDVNAASVLENMMAELPREWELPTVEQLRRTKAVRAWRLPTGFTTWPPYLPGVMFAGDAAGTVKPSNGAGISKALQSGSIAGGCAVSALDGDGPQDLSDYGAQLSKLWGNQYRFGRFVHRIAGRPWAMKAASDLLDVSAARRAAIRFLYGDGGLASYSERV